MSYTKTTWVDGDIISAEKLNKIENGIVAAQESVPDVQINGTSIVDDGVANIPYASLTNAGVIKVQPDDGGYFGMGINSAGFAFLKPAGSDEIKAGEMYTRRPIIPSTQHESVFYGLAKASGDTTQSQSSNAVGTYTDDAKIAIRKMLGIYEAPWELIYEGTTMEDLAELSITVDSNGEPFALSEMYSRMKTPAPLTGTTDYIKGGTYVKYSNSNNPGWGSLTTLRYINASSIGVFEYMHKIVCGICQMQSKCGSGSSNSQNMQFASFLDPDTSVVVESINGIRWQQYNQTSTPIPSGTVVKIYGRRIPE